MMTTPPNPPHRRLLAALAVLALGAATLAGCSDTVSGDAAKPPPRADADGLDPGNYPTEPRPDLGKAGIQGIYVEARRMSDFVTMPFQVDSGLTGGLGYLNTFNGPFKGAAAVGTILDTVFPESATANYVTGFMVSRSRSDGETPYLHSAVLRYNTPEAAAAAAAELGVKGGPDPSRYPNEPPPFAPTSIAGHPEARALVYRGSDTTVVSYTPHGPYLLVQQVYSEADDNVPARLVAAVLDKQIPLIDQFKPTPVDEIPDLPLDPDGLLARTVETPPDLREKFRFGLYGVQGFLAFSDDPAADEKLLNDAGVTAIALSGTDVYQARDAAGAEQIVTTWAKDRESEWTPIDGVPGLDGSRCYRQEDKAGTDDARTLYSCLFAADNYAVDVVAYQKANMRQQAAAQYLLLTAK